MWCGSVLSGRSRRWSNRSRFRYRVTIETRHPARSKRGVIAESGPVAETDKRKDAETVRRPPARAAPLGTEVSELTQIALPFARHPLAVVPSQRGVCYPVRCSNHAI